jgi:hypothetical protein
MKAIIKWPNGQKEFPDCELWDARVAVELDRLAAAGVKDVSLEFQGWPTHQE